MFLFLLSLVYGLSGIMSFHSKILHLWWSMCVVVLVITRSHGLNSDGILLLSFKYSLLSDPLSVLQSWNYNDQTPCSWNGVVCSYLNSSFRVTGLVLPDSQLLGSLNSELGMIQSLEKLDLSNNSINGSLPATLFQAPELRFLDLSNNLISGELPEMGGLGNLEVFNLSDNALAGIVPKSLTSFRNLSVVSLKNNYFSGNLSGGFKYVQVLDLSSNLINGSLPGDFGGDNIRYLNVSYNKLSGEIPPEFAEKIPGNATIDISFNNLTGEIPESTVFGNQEVDSFSGNPDLCGGQSNNPCQISSTPTSPPAIAAIPKTINSDPATTYPGSTPGSSQNKGNRLRPGVIIGIVIGDIAGIGLLGLIILYIYQSKKKKKSEISIKNQANSAKENWSPTFSEPKGSTPWSCLRKSENDDASEETSSSDEEDEEESQSFQKSHQNQRRGTLVSLDSDNELELETLLKASAYILGATGSSILYKAVLEDGTALAVRRIGEHNVHRFRDFENQVRIIAKLIHPNLVRIRGFYWGADEKLIIYDYIPNGNLSNARYRKVGSSPSHLPWEARLKIARGVARGLSYIHEKKHVHGNLKLSSVLLGSDFEPKISNFGLERLVIGETSSKAGGSARNFGSKRSTASRDSFQDQVVPGPSPGISPSPSLMGCASPYHAPESLRSLKPSPKWDVYAFGVILVELLTGKVDVMDEMVQSLVEDKNRVLRMADLAIRAELEGKEDALLACFKLGFSCMSPVPQKRPTMKEVLQNLEKISSTSSTSSNYYYGH